MPKARFIQKLTDALKMGAFVLFMPLYFVLYLCAIAFEKLDTTMDRIIQSVSD